MSSRSLLAIALKFLLLFSLPSFAYSAETASSADSLLKLHQLRLAAQKSLGDFYMYNGMEGDQRYARMIDTSLQNGQALLGSLTQMPGDGSKALLAQLDWVGLDIKALPQRYDAITATPGSGARAWDALEVLLAHGTDHECRTTWHAGLFGVDELLDLARTLAARGVRRWALQECRTPGAPAWALTDAHRLQLAALFPSFALRRA